MRLVKQFVVVAVVALIGSRLVAATEGVPVLACLFGLATAVLSVLAYRWIVRRTEQREPTEVAREGAARGLGRGTLIGVALFAAVILNIAFLGNYDVTGWNSPGGAVALIGFMAAAAATEELLFRGVLFRIIEGRLGTWLALVLTGSLFGLMHIFNPEATPWGAIAIAVEAGGMLAAAYVATRSLWLPIGLHFGWNFAGAGLFGAVISGNGMPDGLLDATLTGPTAITGGEFGPEASLYSVVAGVLVTIAFLRLAKRRGNLVPRRRAEVAEPAGPAVTLSR